ncbi:MAG: ATP-dependent helicase [Clostridia bacterium]|jgi:superfamily II DNA/RNA helicase|nr:ATP-dependent helicase [Clostridia bacterium]
MANHFRDLGVLPSIVDAIKEMGFTEPTEVQQQVIPYILEHKDLIVMSKTGSGKTGAFGIPVLQSITPNKGGPRGLILTPTRELAVQVDQDLKKMSKYLDIRTTAVYGQHDIKSEMRSLKSGTDVVTGTPGRVFDHIKRRTLETKNIQFFVLDEADRMLDMGFIDQMVHIIKELPAKRVTLLFSATMPTEIQRICKGYMHQPITIELKSETKTVDTIKQVYYRMQTGEKRMQLNRLLKVEQPDRCIIFCNTRDEVDRVQAYLSKKGYAAEALHGANSQNHRMKTIQKIKNGDLSIVVATDIAARGIHIDDLSLVINYDVPKDKDSYVHRIGRTARAGNSGKAITLVTSDDIMSLYEIEEHVGVLVDEEELPTDADVKECIEKAQYSRKYANKEPHPKETKQEMKIQEAKVPEEAVKKDEEVTIMVKNIGPVKVTYREEPKEKKSLFKNLKIANYFSRLFKKEK